MKPSVPFDLLEDKHIMFKLALSIYVYILKTKAGQINIFTKHNTYGIRSSLLILPLKR